jgi:cyclohexa-1,5-dienecarbonyl-CoA hydratase
LHIFEVLVDGRVATIRLNSPPRNILTAVMQEALRDAVLELKARTDHNVLCIDSALPDFSVGADVGEHIGREPVARMLAAAHSLHAELLRYPVPVVAVVRGHCLGGGFELALACDRILAADGAHFGLPEIRIGCYPPAGLVLAPLKLPALTAARLITTGDILEAREIPGIESGDTEAVRAYADLPRGVLAESVRLLRCGAAERYEAAVGGIEQAYLERLLALRDAREGPAAFMDKRKPEWDHA